MYNLLVKTIQKFRFLILLFIAIAVFFSLSRLDDLSIDFFPEFNQPIIEVQTEALGLAASEVEMLVTLNLEEMLNNTPWLKSIHSRSIPGLSSIILEFEDGTDIMDARQMVQESLILAHTIPNVSSPPTILQQLSSIRRVMMIGLTSSEKSLIETSMTAYWNIMPSLMSIPGVANVSIWGQRNDQLQVHVDTAKLRSNKISLDEIIHTTGDSFWISPLSFLNASTPGSGGWIDTPNQRLGILHVLPISSQDDLSAISVGDTNLQLGDVASVVSGHQPLIGDSFIDGDPGIMLVVEKMPGSNTLDITKRIEKKIEELKPGLVGIDVDTTIFRPATFIENKINSLMNVFGVGAFLVFLFFLFFYRWRVAIVGFLMTVLPLLIALYIFYLFNLSVNTMVLVGVIASIGIIVDSVVIYIDKISTGLGKWHNRMIFLSLLVIIIMLLVVLPVFLVKGPEGLFLYQLITTYGLLLFLSLFFLLLIPVIFLNFHKSKKVSSGGIGFRAIRKLQHIYEKIFIKVVYRNLLNFFILIVITLIVGLGVFLSKYESFLPDFKEPIIVLELESMSGTSYIEMSRIVRRASNDIKTIPGIVSVGAHIGRSIRSDEIKDINSAKLWIGLDRDIDRRKIIDNIENLINDYPGINNGITTYLQQQSENIFVKPDSLMTVRVYGPEFNLLNKQAENLKKEFLSIEGIIEPTIIDQSLSQQIQIKVNLVDAKKYGIKPGDVRRAVSTIVNGLVVGNFFENQRSYDVVVWGSPDTRDSLSDLSNILLDTPSGRYVKLGDIADLGVFPTPNVIKRESVSRYIDVSFKVGDHSVDSVVNKIEKKIRGYNFPLEYRAVLLGAGVKNDFNWIYLLIISIIGIFLLLHSFFNSWRLATLSFLTLPMALSGGLLAAFFFGSKILSLGSLVGFLTILGVATRNGIMLISHYQYLEREEGMEFGYKLVLRGAKERLSPILMTAVTTALALIPLVVAGNIPGHEIEHPMAIVILGGLFSSTMLNLFFVPSLYLRFGKSRKNNFN